MTIKSIGAQSLQPVNVDTMKTRVKELKKEGSTAAGMTCAFSAAGLMLADQFSKVPEGSKKGFLPYAMGIALIAGLLSSIKSAKSYLQAHDLKKQIPSVKVL